MSVRVPQRIQTILVIAPVWKSRADSGARFFVQGPSGRSASKIDMGATMKKKKPPDDAEQSKRFLEKAREIGAKEKNSTADELMARLARTSPERREKK
jgi:hypothetical protein